MPQLRENTLTRSIFLASLREEADFMPQCVFDELGMQYPNIKQLQRILSQIWIRSWDRWIHIQDMLALYDKERNMQKWLCEHAVIEITSVSLLHMVVSVPSEEEWRLQLLRDGFFVCDIDGFDYNCFSEGVLQRLHHDKMFKIPDAESNVTTWKSEACDDVRNYVCSQDDECVWPIQRDQHNRVCDVYKEQHKPTYLTHCIHSAHTILFL